MKIMSGPEPIPPPISVSPAPEGVLSDSAANHRFSPADYELIEKRGFELLQECVIPDTRSTLLVLRHKESSATILSLHNEDRHKWIQIAFQTLPSDSTGVFHKLEHALLSGSPNIKVREPFDEMTRSLLLTDVNASTGDDFTAFYLGSTDEQSLKLGGKIFFDAVLHGNLSEDVFKREHGYLRPVARNNGDEIWRFGGVVHDEMRGYYSDPFLWMDNNFSRALLPDSPYAHDAGGNPAEMPKLTYQEFLEAYRKFYDTSNMVCVLYGDHSLASRLEFLDKNLKGIKGKGEAIEVPKPMPFVSPRDLTASYPFSTPNSSDLEHKIYFQIGWKFPFVLDHQERLELRLLQVLLSTAEFSPFTQLHRQSGIDNIHLDTSLNRQGKEECFVFLFGEGTHESPKQSKDFTIGLLSKLAKDGIPREIIDTVLNQEEYKGREALQHPFRARGISEAFMDAALKKEFDFDKTPFTERLESIRTKLDAGERVFESLIEKYLLQNNDRLCLTHNPDQTLFRRWNKIQSDWVRERVEDLGPDGLEKQRKDVERLSKLEDGRDSADGLKTVPISILQPEVRKEPSIPVYEEKYGDVLITHQPQDTQGLSAFTLSFDLRDVPVEKISLIGFLGAILTRTGSNRFGPGEYSAKVGRETGGISFGIEQFPKFGTPNGWDVEPRFNFSVSGKGKPAHYLNVLRLIQDPILLPNYQDREYLRFLVKQLLGPLEMGQLEPTAVSKQVVARLKKGTSISGDSGWQTSSEKTIETLKSLEARLENDWDDLRSELEELHRMVFRSNNFIISVTVDDNSWSDLKPVITQVAKYFSDSLPSKDFSGKPIEFSRDLNDHAAARPLANNYVGEEVSLFHPDGTRYTEHGKAEVMCAIINRHLNREIRQKGNAYGATTGYDPFTSSIIFLSWQDPNIKTTLDAYRGSLKFLRQEVTLDFLERARVEAMSKYEKPFSPIERGETGLSRLFSSLKDSDIELVRNQIMDTSMEDIMTFADRLEDAFSKKTAKLVYGNPDHIQEAIESGVGLLVD